MSLTLDTATAAQLPNDLIKDSTDQAFMADVITASKAQPVIVDFWAPWCGPCKQLGPAIEKMVREARGKVKLVKVNIDENPQVASQLRVQSIPAVFAFVDGRPVDGFMGAQPESSIRQFVDRLGKMGGLAEQIAEALNAARQLVDEKDFEGAIDVAGQMIGADPAHAEAYAIKAMAEIQLQQLEQATATLAALPADKAGDAHVLAARAALDLALNPVDTSAIGKLEQSLAANPNDHAARVELAVLLNGAGNREAATDHLLMIVKKDRTWNEDGARKQLVQFFEGWGPKDEATLSARRKLSSVLFS
jgi:putative thioredoxin